jgi:hypothetical protein
MAVKKVQPERPRSALGSQGSPCFGGAGLTPPPSSWTKIGIPELSGGPIDLPPCAFLREITESRPECPCGGHSTPPNGLHGPMRWSPSQKKRAGCVARSCAPAPVRLFGVSLGQPLLP